MFQGVALNNLGVALTAVYSYRSNDSA